MGTRSRFAFIGLLAAAMAASCNSGGGSSSGPSTGTRLTLAGNSVSRTLFEKGLIPAFEANYAKGHPLSADARFFQNGPSNDGWAPAGRGGRGGNANAPPEGEEEGLRAPGAGRGPGRAQGKQ